MALQEDGKVLIAGNFTSYNGTGRTRMARLDNIPLLSGFVATSASVCVGSPASFTATVGNVTGSYSYTISNGTTSVNGTSSSTAFSQTLTSAGSGSQTFTLTIQASNGSAQATTTLTVVSHPDYQPLADLFNSTNGANWTNKTGWLADCNPCGWFGVSCLGGRVTRVDVHNNGLNGSIRESIGSLTNLQWLYLYSNQLSGSIPSSLGNLTNLKELYLYSNQLSGTIPEILGGLTNLQSLQLGFNQLSGSIPASLSGLTGMYSLSLFHNQLSGSVPESFGSLTSMQFLYLDNNQLSGSIPSSLGNLTKLQNLQLHSNQLTSSIPASFGNLSSLQNLHLENNQLSGCYPSSLTALCGIAGKNFSGNAGLPGGGSATAFVAFCATGQGSDAFVPTATASLSAICVGGVVSLSTAGGNSYTWTAPDGTVFTSSASSSMVSVSLTTAGVQTFTVVVSQGGSCSQTATVSVTVNPLPTVSITPSNATLTCASPIVSLLASGGDTYRWEDNSTGATRSLSTAGTYSVTATTASGCWATTSATITSTTAVISITNPMTTTGTTGSLFSQTFSATGGASPYSFSLASGSLPTGLTLSATGELSGTIAQSGTYPITVQATDAGGCSGVSATYTLVINPAVPCGAVVYVTQAGAGLQDGTSWTNAFSGSALQTAINTAANCGAQVWVAKGLYKPTSTTDRTISFAMRDNIVIYGGFMGTEASLNQRPAVGISNPSSTTLSGEIDNDGTLANNSYHIVSNPRGLTPAAVLDGFVITGGNADGSSSGINNLGSGLYNNGSGSGQFCNPTIRNCLFQGNVATRGGAIYNDGRGGTSNPQISNCFFLNNSAIGGGGAIWNAGNVNGSSSPQITNCLFQNNFADFFGGGAIFNDAEAPGTSSPQLINCSFLNNSATSFGGAIWNGALGGTSSPQLTNCSFQGNSSVGGVIYSRSNTSGSSTPQLTNCVFFNNGSGNLFVNNSASVTVSYSLFGPDASEYISGPGNLTATTSPFASTTSTRLAGCSPALNAGLNTASGLNGITTDLAGNPRQYNNGTVDMGAYEYQGDPTTITVSNPSVVTAVQGDAFSQQFTASGGTGTYSYSLASGTLPTGLTVSTAGVLSGTPTQSGTFPISVRATDADGCSGVSATYTLIIKGLPDLAGILYTSPAVIYGNSTCSVVVDVVDVSGTTTSGLITVYITKDPMLRLQLNGAATFVGGHQVQNSMWQLDGESNSSCYVLTTSQPISGGSKLSVGLTGQFSPGTTKGNLTVSALVVGSGIGEVNMTNNADADKIDYFNK